MPNRELLFSLADDVLLELARLLDHFVLLLQSGPPTSTLQINGSGTKKMPSWSKSCGELSLSAALASSSSSFCFFSASSSSFFFSSFFHSLHSLDSRSRRSSDSRVLLKRFSADIVMRRRRVPRGSRVPSDRGHEGCV